MAIQAQLEDGTTLEFPDETDPAVVQATVKKHLGVGDAAPAATPPSQGPIGEFLTGMMSGANRLGGSILSGVDQGNARAFHALGNVADMVSKVGPIPGAPEVRDWARLHEGNAAAQAAEAMPANPGIMDKVNAGIGSAPEMLAEMLPAAKIAGPIAGMAGVNAVQAADQGPEAAAIAAAKGGLMGATQEVTAPLTTVPRIAVNAAAGGGQAALEGGNASDVASNAIMQGAFGALPTGGDVTARDLVTGRNRAPVAEPPVLPEGATAIQPEPAYQPTAASPAVQAVLDANAVKPPAPVEGRAVPAVADEIAHEATIKKVEDALAARAATQPAQPLENNADVAAREAKTAEQATAQRTAIAKAPAELTTEQLADARAKGEQPPEPAAPDTIAVGPEVRTGGDAPAATTARTSETDAGTEAGIARARGDDISTRIGEDAGVLVHQQFGIPTEQYATMPTDAKERLVAAAQRQRSATAPADGTLRVSDTSGEGPTSPASAPQQTAGEAGRGIQPTDTELAASGEPRAATATGTSDRPFKAESTDGATPEQQAGFEQQARATAADARQASQDDLTRQWQERSSSRQAAGEQPFAEAQQQYAGGANFSTKAAAPDAEGRYGTDKWGFVASDKGGPVRFADQKQAAKWIIGQGHAKSPDQIFEIENHPSGKGFTVRERGRSEAAPNQATGQGAEASRSTTTAPSADAQRVLPGPIERQQESDRGPVLDERGGNGSAALRDETPNSSDTRGNAAEPVEGAGAPVPPKGGDNGPAESSGTRPAEEARAPDDTRSQDPADDAHADQDETVSHAGATLYSNPFADPKAWADLARAVAGPAKAVGHEAMAWASGMKALGGKLVDALKSSTSLSTRAVLRGAEDVHNFLIGSKAGQMMTIANRTGSAAVRELHDMFMSDPAGKKSVGRTFDEAIQRDASSWTNRLAQILDPLIKGIDPRADNMRGSVAKSAMLDQLGKQIRSGTADPKTAMGKAAIQIAALLKEVHTRAVESGMDIGEVKKNYLPREIDINKAVSDPKTFIKAATDAYMADGMSAKDAAASAEEWHRSILMKEMGVRPDNADFVRMGTGSPGGNATKGRSLSTNAEAIMSKAGMYFDNPADALTSYFRRMARASAWTERMGPDLEKWGALKERMIADGVGDSTKLVVDLVSKMAGMQAPLGAAARIASNTLRTLTAYTYLTGAPILHIGQSIMTAARTGNPMNTLRAYGTALNVLVGKGKTDVRTAETLGLIERGMGDLLTETVGTKSDSIAKFFHMVGLEPLIRAQSVGNMNAAFAFVRHLAFEHAEGDSVAVTRHLNSLGIPEADHAGFTGWVRGLQGGDGTPGFEDFAKGGKNADLMQLAAQRIINQVIMRPTSAYRPTWAEHPVGSLVYGITSYAQAFNKLATERAWTMGKSAVTEGGLTLRDRMSMLAPAAMIAALWTPIQYGLWELRQHTLNANPDKPAKMPETTAGWIERIAASSGLMGRYEMPYNLIAGIKFSRDPASALTGPELSGLSDVVKRGIQWATADKAEGLNARRDFADAAYRNLAYPAMMAALVHSPLPPNTPFGMIAKGAAAYALRNPVVRHEIFVNPVTGTTANKLPPGQGGAGRPAGMTASARPAGSASGRSAGR